MQLITFDFRQKYGQGALAQTIVLSWDMLKHYFSLLNAQK